MNMVLSAPALGGVPCRRFVVAFALPWQEKKWLLCLVVLPKVRIFVVLLFPPLGGRLLGGQVAFNVSLVDRFLPLIALFVPKLSSNYRLVMFHQIINYLIINHIYYFTLCCIRF